MDLTSLLQGQTGWELALTLPLKQLLDLCETNTDINQRFCNNEDFWLNKFQQDFPNSEPNPNLSWKQNYLFVSNPNFLRIAESVYTPLQIVPNLSAPPLTKLYDSVMVAENSGVIDVSEIMAHVFHFNVKNEPSDLIDRNNRRLLNIKIIEDILKEEYENITLSNWLIENFPKDEYFQKYSRADIENMTHDEIMSFVNLFGLTYINDAIAKRRVMNILNHAKGIKNFYL